MIVLQRWKLDDLVSPDDAGAKKVIASFEEKVRDMERWRDKLAANISLLDFLTALTDYKEMVEEKSRLEGFAVLKLAADTQNQVSQVFNAQIEELLAKANNRTIFFILWWKDLAKEDAQRLKAVAGPSRYWLEQVRRFKPHTLSEGEEKIIGIKDVTGVRAFQILYETITNNFSFNFEVGGGKKILTEEELKVFVRHTDPNMRELAYKEFYRVFGENYPLLHQIYTNIVRDWRNENVDLRNFKSPISVRNFENDFPDEVVDNLLSSIVNNTEVFRQYLQWKTKYLGMPKLRRYDIFAPLSRIDRKYSYGEAAKLVLDTFYDFSPEFGKAAQKVFDDCHIDSEILPGKERGAFCTTSIYGLTPWVLLNYNGRFGDILTMAHELGHAVHTILAGRQSVLTFQSSLPLAETASVFAEMLLTEKLLLKETDITMRRRLLAYLLDDAYGTICRQGYFTIWEKEAHEMVIQGRTANEMAERYLEHLKRQFGEAAEISEEFKWEWVSVPHFYETPFYVYAYPFGHLLTIALFRMFKQEGKSFIAKYFEVIAAGGSDSPAKILQKANIDIFSPAIWEDGFQVIRGMLAELKNLK